MNKIDINRPYMKLMPDLWKFHQLLTEINVLLNHTIKIKKTGLNEYIASKNPDFHKEVCEICDELWDPLNIQQLQEMKINKKYEELADNYRYPVLSIINRWNDYIEEYEKQGKES